MTVINCKNQNRKRKIDLGKIKKAVRIVLKKLKKDKGELNIYFFSNCEIKKMNRRYLGIDKETDVLAFPAAKKRDSRFLGDIAVSSDKAAENSKIYGTLFFEELNLYVVHGILHLMGYGDKTDKEKRRIRKKENGLLKKIRIVLQ